MPLQIKIKYIGVVTYRYPYVLKTFYKIILSIYYFDLSNLFVIIKQGANKN